MKIKNGTAYLGDCLEIMKGFDSESIDLTVTSPPYDNLRTYNDSLNWNFDIFKEIAKELYRITKEGGVVVWIVGDQTIKGSESGTSFKQALFFKEIGFNLHDTMIYAKNSYMPLTHNRYEQAFEYMFILSKGRPIVFNPIKIPSVTAGTKKNRLGSKSKEKNYSERLRDETTIVNSLKQSPNIFYYDVGHNDKTKHNAPFPEKLAEDHILSWSNPGDIVLDPFGGSFTTGKMAELNGRKWICIEKYEGYYNIGINRIQNLSN